MEIFLTKIFNFNCIVSKVMKAYDILSYLVEHAKEGSIAALTTKENIPILIVKNDEYSFTSYICLQNGDVKTIVKEYDKTTFHRAILDFIDQITLYLGGEINELKISDAALFTNCLPKKEEKSRRKTKIEENIPQKIEQLRNIQKPFHVIPLLTDNQKLVAYVPEMAALKDFDFIAKSVSRVDNKVEPATIDFAKLYLVLFTNKLDPNQGNPFTTINNTTFFTACFIDLGDKGKGDFGGKNTNKRIGRFFIATHKGGLKSQDTEFLDFDTLNKGRLYLGLFIKKDDKILKLNSMSLVDLHISGKITLNSYLFSSFAQTARDDIVHFADYDKLFSNFLNLAVAKSDGKTILKDTIEIHSMITDLPFSAHMDNNQIKIVDPISFWYYSINNEDIKECYDCPLKDKVALRREIVSMLKRRGWMNVFIL